MGPKTPVSEGDFFRQPLREQINLKHPLVRLADLIDWDRLSTAMSASFVSRRGRPATSPRLIAGLLYLQHAFDLSDEDVVWQWLENPYWQVFTGETYLQTRPPIDASSLTRWRKRLGEAGIEELLAETIQAAKRANVIKTASLKRVIVDTTVMKKAIAHPTDSRLLERCREHLVKAAARHRLKLRQNTNREAPRLASQVGRYAHAKQYKRMNKALRTLRSRVGRVMRDVERQLDGLAQQSRAALDELISRTKRILTHKQKDKNKLYALHAPEVECLAKVRREVANIIVSPAHKVGDETGRSVGRSLPVHALPATATCEATGTTCRAFWPRRLPRGRDVICEHQCGWDPRLSGMVNRCELPQASLGTTSQRC